MNRLCSLLICLNTSIGAFCAQQSSVVKIPFQDTIDCTTQVREALEKAGEGNLTLEFEEGVYHFYPEKAKGLFICVSNNDNGYKRVAFYLDKMKNVIIKGHKTEFMFHGAMVPFYIRACENISLSGIDIDYDTSFILEGKVVANNETQKSIDLKLSKDVKYKVIGSRFFYQGYDWSESLGQNIVFDPATKAPYYYTSRFLHTDWKNELTAQDLGGGIVRFSAFSAQEIPPVGSIYIDKGPYEHNRLYPGIIIHASSNVFLSDMNIYMAGAMSLIAETSKNITMKNFNVKLRDGSGRYISASADATHFVNCRGTIRFEDCLFENMLDDATNVHGTYMIVDQLISDKCIAVQFGHLQQEGFSFASEGDTLQLIDRGNLMPLNQFVVQRVERINNDYYLIHSTTSIPPFGKGTAVAVENLTNTASLIMKRCAVRNNRARSILISTPRHVLIEDNYFDSMMAGILIAGDANYWFESGNVSDVVIRNNTFVNMGKGGEAPQSVLQISPEIPTEKRKDGYYHGKILFENNTIKTFDSQVIYALSVCDLTIINNKFIQTKDYKPIFENLSYIDLQNCKQVQIYGNYYQGDNKVEISAINCENIKVKKQTGFGKEVVRKPNVFYYKQ